MRLFARYVRQHFKGLLMFLLFTAVFAAAFLLYGIPVEAVLYPACLCAAFGAGAAAFDFLSVKRKYAQLEELKGRAAELIDELPEAETVEGYGFYKIILALQRQLSEESAAAAARCRDMEEYYTVWVHQIKTPIASMRLKLEGEDSAFSRSVSSDLLQIERYVDMVLAFLRLDSDTGDYVFKEYPLDSIIEYAVAKFASEFIDRKLRLDYRPAGVTVVTDEKWLAFVLEQVLSNALKYTNEGEVRIYMGRPRTLCIEDTGIGIDASDLPRVFEKGYTGCNGRKDKRASGLGLYLCRRICERLGVGISISSKPKAGTTVKIDLEQYSIKKD